jgi:phosphoribosyl 1,2-cyclic phosphate phosphodiesterase
MTNCTVTILGCGGSGGVPLATGYWGKCNPNNPKNRRRRASIAIQNEKTCIVIDSGPDFHEQTLIHNISHIDAVLYSHDHADHINGLDDVRYLAIKQRIQGRKDYKFPIYSDKKTLEGIIKRFDYLFRDDPNGLYIPLIESKAIEYDEELNIGHINLKMFRQIHGFGHSNGFIIGDLAYSTDVSDLSDEALQNLKGIKTWVVDCGQFGSDKTTVHANYERVLELNEIVGAKKLYLTHLKPDDDYDVLMNQTPDYIEPAYDGLVIKVST